MTWDGLAATGQCVLILSASPSDACHFTIGASRLSAVDTFDYSARVWRRHYGDGVDVTIAAPAGSRLIPIPFPLGR